MPRKRNRGLRNTYKNLSHDAALQANVVAYLNGTTSLKVDFKNAKSAAGVSRHRVGIIPFYAVPDTIDPALLATFRVPIAITKQAVQIGKTIPAVDAANLWETAGVEFDISKVTGDAPQGWYPALARLSVVSKSAGTTVYASTTQTSHITGRKYKLAKRRSGSVPFGRSVKGQETGKAAGTKTTIVSSDYGEVEKAIEALVANYNKDNGDTLEMSVSFEPEVKRENTSLPSDGITPDTAGTLVM